jgi:hypothetical protein
MMKHHHAARMAGSAAATLAVVLPAYLLLSSQVAAAADNGRGTGSPKQRPTLAESDVRKTAFKKPSTRVAPPASVDPHEDDQSLWIASWGKSISVKFTVRDNQARVIWINKKGFPEYTGGQMIADSLRAAKAPRPSTITMPNIAHKATVAQLESGMTADKTALGNTLLNTVEELGGRVVKWTSQARPYPWITVTVDYPSS